MTRKELNKMSEEYNVINTGYKIYICCDEIWKRGKYNNKKTEFYVSSLGRVFNITKNKFAKIFKNDSGYLYCQSYYNGKRTSLLINKLVAETFLGFPFNIKNPEADHINRDKLDNNIANLRWLSREENLARRELSDQSGQNNSNSKYSKNLIIKIAKLLESGQYTVSEISKIVSVPYSTVNDIKRKERWKEILNDFDFSNVPKQKPVKRKYTEKDILSVANLIIENQLSLTEISLKTGVSYDTVRLIKNKKCYKKLLSDYDFSIYNKNKSIFSQEQLKDIDKLIYDGLTPKEICDNLNIEYTKKIRMSLYDRKRKIIPIKN